MLPAHSSLFGYRFKKDYRKQSCIPASVLLLDELLTAKPPQPKAGARGQRFKGIAKGIWPIDAQKYVNAWRNEDRF